jgi:hypothetical protein
LVDKKDVIPVIISQYPKNRNVRAYWLFCIWVVQILRRQAPDRKDKNESALFFLSGAFPGSNHGKSDYITVT